MLAIATATIACPPELAPVIRRDVPKQYASLKALCERGATFRLCAESV